MVAIEGVSVLEHDVYKSLVLSLSLGFPFTLWLKSFGASPVPWELELYAYPWFSHPRYDAYRKQFAAHSRPHLPRLAVVPLAVMAGWVK